MSARFAAFLVPLILVVQGQTLARSRRRSPEIIGPPVTKPVPLNVVAFQQSYPYTVSLRRRSDKGFVCAGVLISKRHVLTAAHCVDATRSSSDTRPLVVAGTPFSSETSGDGVQSFATVAVFEHPEYQTRRAPNLAILKLSSDADQTPVRLPKVAPPVAGARVMSIGWGRQSSTSGASETVQAAHMTLVPPRTCSSKKSSFIRRFEICMGGDGDNTCEGDDGGPIVLLSEDTLVGIMGADHVCGRSSNPDVHTKIWPFMDWIKSTAGIP